MTPQSLIDAYHNIQALPYEISMSCTWENHACSGKHMKLKQTCDDLDIPARYRVVQYKWSDLNLPENVLNIPHEDVSTHVYLEVYARDTWIDLDATWDPGLQSLFQVTEWNGEDSTPIAVPVIKTFDDVTSQKIMSTLDQDAWQEHMNINKPFYQAINECLEQTRTHG